MSTLGIDENIWLSYALNYKDFSTGGPMAEWLCSGLQNRVHRFNSGSGLHLFGVYLGKSFDQCNDVGLPSFQLAHVRLLVSLSALLTFIIRLQVSLGSLLSFDALFGQARVFTPKWIGIFASGHFTSLTMVFSRPSCLA